MSAPALSSELWQRLAAYAIGPDTAVLSFPARLARENRWTQDHAERVILEYKRFCYLACTAGHEVTPSDAVDQVWHLHLTYSRDYWERFCPDILGTALHHGPTAGGREERTRYYDQYAATLQSYEVAFGRPAPPDIWRDAGRRFKIDPKGVRINPEDAMIMSRGRFMLALTLASLGAFGAGLFAGGFF
jgi:hypothetical protein